MKYSMLNTSNTHGGHLAVKRPYRALYDQSAEAAMEMPLAVRLRPSPVLVLRDEDSMLKSVS